MPNRHHTEHDCDEGCRGCFECYVRTGATVCDWTCPHVHEQHEVEADETPTGTCTGPAVSGRV